MQVSTINPNKVKIVLTNTEVLCCFCSYEKLLSMCESTKILMKALLRDIAKEHSLTDCERLTARIHAGENYGCVIILSGTEHKKTKLYTLEFNNSENLIRAIFLLKNRHKCTHKRSRLYLMKNTYRLLIESSKDKDYFLSLTEFCDNLFSGRVHFEYTKEYGKPIIEHKAISRIANCFSKDF